MGDTALSNGITFMHFDTLANNDTVSFCYFLRNNDYFEPFITDPNPNNDTVCFTVIYKKRDDVGINKLAQSETINISPNPASQFINIPLVQGQTSVLKVYNLEGRLLTQENIAASSQAFYQYPTTTLNTGMYILQLEQEGKIKRSKFVIQR
jgi:hypothetical protein